MPILILIKIHCENKSYFDAAAQFRLFLIEMPFIVIAIALYSNENLLRCRRFAVLLTTYHKMCLAAFHLLMNVNYGYTFYGLLSTNYSGVTDRYLITMRDMGFGYLTVWNMVSEGLHFAMWNLVRATVWNMMRASVLRR